MRQPRSFQLASQPRRAGEFRIVAWIQRFRCGVGTWLLAPGKHLVPVEGDRLLNGHSTRIVALLSTSSMSA